MLKVEVRIKKVNEIKTKERRKWMLAELDSWEQKREVMTRKKNLEKDVIIEDDLTRKKRKVQKKLWDVAREKKEKGDDKVKIGYVRRSTKRKMILVERKRR